MTEFYKPLDFYQIAGAPHDILNDAMNNLPIFEGNNATTANTHLRKSERHLVSYCDNVASNHEDIKIKLFALSLEDDAVEWYENLGDDSYKTINEFLAGFKKRWGEKKEPRDLLAALHNIKKMENETIDEFNTKFMRVVADLPREIKPRDASILIYYIEAFTGDLRYQLRDKEPADLKTAQDLAEKIERNMQSSGKSNIPGYTRGNTSYNEEKGKAYELEEKTTSKDPMEKIASMLEKVVTNQDEFMTKMQNRMVTWERNNEPRNFQPKQNQVYQKKFPQQEPRIPNQLDSTNLVDEVIPWCRPCEQFHPESTCYIANRIIENGMAEVSNQETNSSKPDHIYMVGQAYPLLPSKQYNPEDETIAESYSETYDENCNIHDGTPMCSPYNDDSLEGLLPCDLFSEEDEYENEDKYSLEHDTSDEDSLIPDKDVDEESWTFMENPVCDMNKEENNELETFDGFVDFSVYGISKGESMDHMALGNFDMKREHVVYPHDQSETYIDISSEDKENSISEPDMSNGESITFNTDDGDDYWDFCGYLFKNPIHAISNEGSVYLEICGSPIYYNSIEGSMNLETLENPSMQKQHSKLLYDHSESYHAELHKSISNEDIEKQYCEKLDVMQLVENQSQPSFSHIEVPYDLELLGVCATSYHLITPGDQYDDVVNLPHHSDWYISPIQSWIEAACMSTYKLGKNFFIHAYDLPSIPPILNHHAGLHFLNKVSLLWLVTKDKGNFFYVNKMLRWLHWISDYT